MLVASDGDGVNEAKFYSDVERDVFMRENWNIGPPRHMAKTLSLKTAPAKPFLTANDDFIVEMEQVRPFLDITIYASASAAWDEVHPGYAMSPD